MKNSYIVVGSQSDNYTAGYQMVDLIGYFQQMLDLFGYFHQELLVLSNQHNLAGSYFAAGSLNGCFRQLCSVQMVQHYLL